LPTTHLRTEEAGRGLHAAEDVVGRTLTVIGAAFEGGVTAKRVRGLAELIGYPIDRRTLTRWVKWWRAGVPKSRAWKVMRGLFSREVETGRLPLSLLEMMAGPDAATRVKGVLELLSGRRIDRAM